MSGVVPLLVKYGADIESLDQAGLTAHNIHAPPSKFQTPFEASARVIQRASSDGTLALGDV